MQNAILIHKNYTDLLAYFKFVIVAIFVEIKTKKKICNNVFVFFYLQYIVLMCMVN